MFQTLLSFLIGLASGVLVTLLIQNLRERQRIKKLQHSNAGAIAPEMEELTTWAPDLAWDTEVQPESALAANTATALQDESQENQTSAFETAGTISPPASQEIHSDQDLDSADAVEPEVEAIAFETEFETDAPGFAELTQASDAPEMAAMAAMAEWAVAESGSDAIILTEAADLETPLVAEVAAEPQMLEWETEPIEFAPQQTEPSGEPNADLTDDLADQLAIELAAQVEAELAAQAEAELAAQAEAERAAQAAAELAAQAAAELAAQAEAELAAQAEAELAAQAEAELAALAEAELAAQAEAELAAQAAAELAALAEAELAAQAAAELAAQAEAQEQARQAALELARLEAARIAQEEQERASQQALALQQQAELEAERLEAERLEAEWQSLQAQSLAEPALELAPPAPPAATKMIKDPADTIILVADDSKVVRVKTSRVLAKHTYQVNLAEDGIDAANQIAFALPDVLVTDVEMPGMDGFALTLHLRNNPATAHLPIIMISGASDELADKAKQAGVNVLLGKPYADEDLIGHIQRLVQDAPL